eukprot:TRINITY_DN2035_c0_g1_i14.p1 TRINITY_DN2035_c0_g1~~TRINITY_DN2035_c0_g1_i14.p1  ORF type:complete len:239 (+),score=41.83 TRINITY_DN2035_c0_g1_i14:104-820(+)
MRSSVFIFVGVALTQLALCNYDHTCQFQLSKDSAIDLSPLKRETPPDYVYYNDNVFYVINLCAPTIKICNGIEGSFASVWNANTYACIQTIGGGSPKASYIDEQNHFRGVNLNYSNAIVQIACDQAYDRPALVNVVDNKVNGVSQYTFYFKSKSVCTNYSVPTEDHWSGTAIFIVILLILVFMYLGYGAYMTTREGQYLSFTDAIPQKEFVMNVALKGKELVNKVFRTSEPSSSETKT